MHGVLVFMLLLFGGALAGRRPRPHSSAASRATRPLVPGDGRLEEVTVARRHVLREQFRAWLIERGGGVLEALLPRPKELAGKLEDYGLELYGLERPAGDFSDTITLPDGRAVRSW